MQKIRKLAAFCAVFILCFSLFCTAAYAEPEEENPTEQATVVKSTEPPENEIVNNAIPPGTGTVVDVFTGEDGRKFYTIKTPAGNTFYLIIDFNKQSENVYFLDAVNENDLLALAEKANNNQLGGNVVATTTKNSNTSDPKSGNSENQKPETSNISGNFTLLLVVLVILIGGGAGYYLKIYRKKRENDSRDEYEDEYQPDEPDDYDEEPDDDSVPWDEEDENV